MKDEDYPALYQSTNQAAIDTQKYYVRLNIGYLTSTILGTICSVFSDGSSVLAVASPVLFLIGLFLVVIILTKKHDNSWYASRAAAESIKTATWRFMMRAEPFGGSSTSLEAQNKFIETIKEILKETRSIASYFGDKSTGKDQISGKMAETRSRTPEERKAFYVRNRIDEQQQWYSRKAKANKRQNFIWFLAVIGFNLVAGILAIVRVVNPISPGIPVDVFAVLAVSSLSWIQLKRFQDLASSYALTAHEISTIKSLASHIHTEHELSDFVIDAENAFSREHTQWSAKRSS